MGGPFVADLEPGAYEHAPFLAAGDEMVGDVDEQWWTFDRHEAVEPEPAARLRRAGPSIRRRERALDQALPPWRQLAGGDGIPSPQIGNDVDLAVSSDLDGVLDAEHVERHERGQLESLLGAAGERGGPGQSQIDEIVTLPDERIFEAVVWIMAHAKLVVEGAAASTVGALLEGLIAAPPGSKVACVLSGGNVNLDQLRGLRWN